MSKKDLIEGEDYYIEDGKWVFTSTFHSKRGHCCNPKDKIGCKNCPYRLNKSKLKKR